jgi:hypothetical protein
VSLHRRDGRTSQRGRAGSYSKLDVWLEHPTYPTKQKKKIKNLNSGAAINKKNWFEHCLTLCGNSDSAGSFFFSYYYLYFLILISLTIDHDNEFGWEKLVSRH